MINREYKEMLSSKDVIFEIAGEARKRALRFGDDNIFNFSLGNPSVPAPEAVKQTFTRIIEETDPLELHSYSPAGGVPFVRSSIARDLNERYGSHYEGRHIFMTCGAAAALSHALRALTNPGDTVLTQAPCFPEYIPYVKGALCKLSMVPAETGSFQINLSAMEAMLTEDVAAVLLNSPNNPSGAVYSTETIKELSSLLQRKSEAYHHPIYLISDEPYRDIIFSHADSPYIANFYANTITCYSFSKSLSLPGERIGYVAVNPHAVDADGILEILPQVSRTTGHNGAPAILQRVVAELSGTTSDLSIYEDNSRLLYRALKEYGYSLVRPGGTFYMFPASPEPDDTAFCRRAMELNLMLVPGSSFGAPGFFRIAYCVPTERVTKSLPLFRELIENT
ncbi:MAG: pyridoxal phosphate-dependent aminotransferase [Lachnospiraceae bacterium]|nr:pyridoxal phosphate-dependent aminotransferase [Lachnospiraceae bacterium]